VALTTSRSAGMVVLAVYLIVIGVVGLMRIPVPFPVPAVLALLSGVLLLLGR
jgi:hypothetical protein